MVLRGRTVRILRIDDRSGTEAVVSTRTAVPVSGFVLTVPVFGHRQAAALEPCEDFGNAPYRMRCQIDP
jgi:hypothetical protein